MKKILGNYIIDAILLIILGVILLIRPGGTLGFICRLIGIALLVMGAVKLFLYFRSEKMDGGRSLPSLLIGIAQAVFGILLLANPGIFIGFLPFVSGVVIGYGAIVSLIHALRLNKYQLPGTTAEIVLSIITLVLAIIVILHPALISEIIVQMIGISLIVEGVTLLLTLSGKKK